MLVQMQEGWKLIQSFLSVPCQRWQWLFSSWDPKTCILNARGPLQLYFLFVFVLGFWWVNTQLILSIFNNRDHSTLKCNMLIRCDICQSFLKFCCCVKFLLKKCIKWFIFSFWTQKSYEILSVCPCVCLECFSGSACRNFLIFYISFFF